MDETAKKSQKISQRTSKPSIKEGVKLDKTGSTKKQATTTTRNTSKTVKVTNKSRKTAAKSMGMIPMTPAPEKVADATQLLLKAFKKNFNSLINSWNVPLLHYGRQKWVAERYQISPGAARKWLEGKCLPDWNHMLLLSDDFGVSIDELLGRRPLTLGKKRAVAIPLRSDTDGKSSVFANGVVEFESGLLESTLRMRKSGIELHVVSTDSMSPDINEGDIVFVDTEARDIQDNRIYMFSAKGRILIRRLSLNFDDSVRLRCTNNNFQEATLKLADISSAEDEENAGGATLRIVGEILWMIKRVSGSSSSILISSEN